MSHDRPSETVDWGQAGTEPSGGIKSAGWTAKLPAQYENWFWKHVSGWLGWLKDRFRDNASKENFVVQAPNDEGGSLSLLAGDSSGSSDTNGGALYLACGSARGNGSADTTLYAATPGSSGSTESVPELYMQCDGLRSMIRFNKPVGDGTGTTFTNRIPGYMGHGSAVGSMSYTGADGTVRILRATGNEGAWPVYIPRGGVITGIQIWCASAVGTANATMTLYRIAPASSGAATSVTSNSNASISTTWGYQLSSTGLSHTILSTEIYWVHVDVAGSNDLDVGFIELTYTVTDYRYPRLG